MKFSRSSGDILKALSVGAGALAQNAVVPITEDFLFILEGDELTIITTNLNQTIVTKTQVHGQEDGTMAVAGKILLDTIKSLPEQPVTISHDELSGIIEIETSSGEFKLAGDNPEDFPGLQEEEGTQSILLASEKLIDAINNTHYATSNDEARPAMNGILMQVDFNKINFVATDAHRLVKHSISEVPTDITASVILPSKPMSQLKNLLPEGEEVEISMNKSHAFFKFGNTKLITRLIDAQFPDYNLVIPRENKYHLRVDRKLLLSALKRIAIYANKSTNQVVFNIQDSALTLHAQDIDFSNEATEQIPCSFDGEEMSIGLNGKFLLEMLSSLSSEEVIFNFDAPNRAGLLYPAEQESNVDVLMLLMPVMR